MLPDIPLYLVITPAVFVVVLLGLSVRFRIARNSSKIEKAIVGLKFSTISLGCIVILLWLCLPSTPSLSTFGYPQSITDIESGRRLLDYLQTYNEALVRTTEVIHWFLFLFVFWFLAAFYPVLKLLNKNQPETIGSEQNDAENGE